MACKWYPHLWESGYLTFNMALLLEYFWTISSLGIVWAHWRAQFWKSFVFSPWVLWERESLTGGGNDCFRDQLRPCWNGSGPAVWQDFWEVMGNKYKHLSFWLKGSYVYLISLSFCTNSLSKVMRIAMAGIFIEVLVCYFPTLWTRHKFNVRSCLLNMNIEHR